MYRTQPELWRLVQPRLEKLSKDGVEDDVFAAFCGVNTATAHNWTTKGQPPTGERFIKLWHFIRFLGVTSKEFDEMAGLNRYIGELFAFGVINMQVVLEVFNLKAEQSGYDALRGRKAMTPKLTLDELTQLYGEQLRTAQISCKADLKLPLGLAISVTTKRPAQAATDVMPVAVSAPEPVLTPMPASSDLPAMSGSRHLMLQLATNLSALLPLVKYALSDDCSPEDRSFLRDHLGQDAMFHLSNQLNSLCSERARRQAR